MASSLTITPALGHSLVTAQGMPGGYDAIDDRSFWSVALQEGVVDAGAFEVTQRAAGANMSVDVACNTGHVVVQGDSVSNQGLYVVRPHTAAANLDISAAHATNPRVDAVVVQIDDDEHDASGNTRARVMTLAGTATAGATLDNARDGSHGGAAIPSNALHLADVLVPATDTTISNSQIRDRRKWARGAFKTTADTSGDISLVSTSYTTVLSATIRLECTGAPLRIQPFVLISGTSANAKNTFLAAFMDSAQVAEAQFVNTAINTAAAFAADWVITPSAGSHVFDLQMKVSSNSSTIARNSTNPLRLIIEELVRQNTANNATTSG